jgi:HNH endonuclease
MASLESTRSECVCKVCARVFLPSGHRGPLPVSCVECRKAAARKPKVPCSCGGLMESAARQCMACHRRKTAKLVLRCACGAPRCRGTRQCKACFDRSVADRSSFECEWCHRTVRRPHKNLKDDSRRFCSKTCSGARRTAVSDAKKTAARVCITCGSLRIQPKYCERCLHQRQIERDARACLQCGASMNGRVGKTCSKQCWAARQTVLLTGKKYRAPKKEKRICVVCAVPYHAVPGRKGSTCKACNARAFKRQNGHSKPESRAKAFGVPYVYGIKVDAVCARDKWRCHLCGCRTPKRLRGLNLPNSPEVDHIIPLSYPGSPGHVWSNVACACRACNAAKSAKPLGQLRLAV